MLHFEPALETNFYKVDMGNYEIQRSESILCPRCNSGQIEKGVLGDTSIVANAFYGQCPVCMHYHNFILPTPIQQVTKMIQNRIVVSIAGVSTGKTTTHADIVRDHVMSIKGFDVWVAAQTEEQRDKFAKAFLDKMIPQEFWAKKIKSEWISKCGGRISFITSDSYQKLKSGEATMIWLVEAQMFKLQIFEECKQRIRNEAARVYEKDEDNNYIIDINLVTGEQVTRLKVDKCLLLVEGNPQPTWIRDNGIFMAHTLIGSQSINVKKYKPFCKPQKGDDGKALDIVGILSSSRDNPYNSEEYLSTLTAGRPQWWIDQELDCDLTYEGGLVYKDIMGCIADSPMYYSRHYEYMEAIDFGGVEVTHHPSGYLLMAYDPTTERFLVLDEYKESGKMVSQIAQEIKTIRRRWKYDQNKKLFFVADPSGKRKNNDDRRSMYDYYEAHDIFMEEAFGNTEKGATQKVRTIVPGILRIVALALEGKIVISPKCVKLIEELKKYRWPEPKLDKNSISKAVDKVPIPLWDDLLDPLRYAVENFMDYIPNNKLGAWGLKQSTETYASNKIKMEDVRKHLSITNQTNLALNLGAYEEQEQDEDDWDESQLY